MSGTRPPFPSSVFYPHLILLFVAAVISVPAGEGGIFLPRRRDHSRDLTALPIVHRASTVIMIMMMIFLAASAVHPSGILPVTAAVHPSGIPPVAAIVHPSGIPSVTAAVSAAAHTARLSSVPGAAVPAAASAVTPAVAPAAATVSAAAQKK